jgi:hypothetical protein
VKFKYHGNLEGRHAFLSPSSYSWIRYDDARLVERLTTSMAAARGSKYHALAHDLITLGVKLPTTKKTMNLYVNDMLGFKMTPEQPLYFSDNCFGTADGLGYRRDRGDDKFTLRIFDLKTGTSKASVDQLLIYAALFFLEYGDDLGIKPFDIQYDLRIYQEPEPQLFEVDPKDVIDIMDKIKTFDRRINELRAEEAE